GLRAGDLGERAGQVAVMGLLQIAEEMGKRRRTECDQFSVGRVRSHHRRGRDDQRCLPPGGEKTLHFLFERFQRRRWSVLHRNRGHKRLLLRQCRLFPDYTRSGRRRSSPVRPPYSPVHSSAVRSSKPYMRLKFCTATPLAPRTRLSSHASTRTRPRTTRTVTSRKFVPQQSFVA